MPRIDTFGSCRLYRGKTFIGVVREVCPASPDCQLSTWTLEGAPAAGRAMVLARKNAPMRFTAILFGRPKTMWRFVGTVIAVRIAPTLDGESMRVRAQVSIRLRS